MRATRAASAMEGVTLTLTVACYNEAESVAATLDALITALGKFQFPWEIIIIDDASSDETSAVAAAYLRRNDHLPLRLLRNPINEGLAQTFINGAFFGRGEYYRLVCGDNVEPVETFVKIFRRIGEADIIVPYHIDPPNRTLLRSCLSTLYTRLINLISGYRLRYYNGLPVFRRWDVMRWHTNYHG